MKDLTLKSGSIGDRIERALDEIRPYLISDGGNIRVIEITKSHNLTVEFTGNCSHCPMSDTTFKAGVEQAIRSAVPEIKKIKMR